MNEAPGQETRYCPTCQKKTTHSIRKVAKPLPSKEKEGENIRLKAECQICRTVN